MKRENDMLDSNLDKPEEMIELLEGKIQEEISLDFLETGDIKDVKRNYLAELVETFTGKSFVGTPLYQYELICKTMKLIISDLNYNDNYKNSAVTLYDFCDWLIDMNEDIFCLDGFDLTEAIGAVLELESNSLENIGDFTEEEFLHAKELWMRILDMGLDAIEQLDREQLFKHEPYIQALKYEMQYLWGYKKK